MHPPLTKYPAPSASTVDVVDDTAGGIATPLAAVVCTHGRPDYLKACLAGLAFQAGGPLPVVVVDSASPQPAADRIARIAGDYGAVLIRTDQAGLSLARNL